MTPLFSLGARIGILGRSNSGKSTLAEKLGKKLGVPVYHLDQIAHVPGTGWQPRPFDEFQRDHDSLVERDAWIIEGNYKRSMPQRLARATAAIWLDMPLAGCVMRYVTRSLRGDPDRPGRLSDATHEFSLSLVRYMAFEYPRNAVVYETLLQNRSFPVLRLRAMRELEDCAAQWEL